MENKSKLYEGKNNIFDYIIIGNSAAGLSAASSIRTIDKNGSIVVLTNENYLNYSKPLITYYLAGRIKLKDIYFKNEDFYKENNILLKKDTNILKIDYANKQVITDKNTGFAYRKLLLANGGIPIIPKIRVSESSDSPSINSERFKEHAENNADVNKNKSIPGSLDNSNFKNFTGIFTFTCLKDAEKVKDYITKNNITEAAVLGGGLIGLKSAEALLELGIKVKIIELSDRILSASFDKQASSIIENELENKGNRIYTQNTINQIFVKNGSLESFQLKSGEIIKSRLLIVAVGVIPDLSIAENSNNNIKKNEPGYLKLNRGILVDEHMQTSIKDVFAAGDVAESFNFVTGDKSNIAIWPLAVRQGDIAGANMAGGNKIYDGGYFMNSVEILNIPTISIGITNAPDDMEGNIEIMKDYKPEKRYYRKIVIHNNKIIGIILVENIDRAGIYNGLIRNKIDISNIKDNLVKEDFGIIQLPSDYKKHLVVGDGIEV
ncbi:FAD-dependent oxidoreductase [bacterium]|nr:FAD-dependent oxidoreductase [bacterium]